MSQSTFYMEAKSTLDFLMYDLQSKMQTEFPLLKATDLDDVTEVADVLGGTSPALVWRFGELEASPSDPLYTLNFYVGAKTTQDAGNYKLSDLLGYVSSVFFKDSSHVIKNYSEEPVTDATGDMYIINSGVAPQQFDHQSGMRLIQVVARVWRRG
ncbi:hypothetical protein [Endozoicomonas sp. ALC066]|uniref:hypothetical protein n=1 Tax=Endozoicomonas sp. ALC066 TaxID=3403078 RepID=UPI003BB78F60